MKWLTYKDEDGLNNQLMALNFACAIASITDRTLMLRETFTPHQYAMVKAPYKLKVCDVVDCPALSCRTAPFSKQPTFICRTLQCVSSSSAPSVELPNKVAFEVGLRGRSLGRLMREHNLSSSVPVHRQLTATASRVLVGRRFNVLHVRSFAHNDYELHRGQAKKNNAGRIRILDDAYVMTQNCSTLVVPIHRCMNNLFSNITHPDLKCVLSQLVAIRAYRFEGEAFSTVSQFAYRRRLLRDPRVKCNAVWCWPCPR